VNWSAAEVSALAAKAARGAGAPPAQAARFGEVAALHLQSSRAPQALADALDALPNSGAILVYPRALDRALAALAQGEAGLLGAVTRCALLESYVAALPFAAQVVERANGLRLEADLKKPRQQRAARRITGCDALVGKMADLAARTFVPESEASRNAGAGAGLLDND
jgi:hypothetical protein